MSTEKDYRTLVYQVVRTAENGYQRDKVWVHSQRRASTANAIINAIDNKAGYGYGKPAEEGKAIAERWGKCYSRMLDAGHSEYFDYDIGYSFSLDYLHSATKNEDGTVAHCSPSVEVNGSMAMLSWSNKIVQKVGAMVERIRAKDRAKSEGRKYNPYDARNVGNWSIENIQEVKRALDALGIVEVERYRDGIENNFSFLVAVKNEKK
jgi:hypothetical protein